MNMTQLVLKLILRISFVIAGMLGLTFVAGMALPSGMVMAFTSERGAIQIFI